VNWNVFSEGWMKPSWRVFDKVVDTMAILAGVVIVFITAAVCYTIGLRFLFTKSTIWITQTTEYALLWIVFLGTTWLLREKGHITTDIIYTHLAERTKQVLDFIMSIVGGIASAVMFILGALYTYECILKGVTDVRAITIPKWILFIIIPIGSFLLTFQFVRLAWSKFIEIRTAR
jgi:C4-dicarboxylate transporter, DctQ subunit